MFLLFGIVYVLLASGSPLLWFGILVIVMGLSAIIYGYADRSEKSKELSSLESLS